MVESALLHPCKLQICHKNGGYVKMKVKMFVVSAA